MIVPSFIGVGQGGTNAAMAAAKKFGSTNIAIVNSSQQDIDSAVSVPQDRRFLFAGGGAGKDRSVGRDIFMTDYKKMTENLIGLMDTDVTFVFFSTSGGTGSGIGPAMTSYLNSQEFSDKVSKTRKTIVMGIALMPSNREGLKSLVNTVGCLSDINKMIDDAGFIPVNNGFSANDDLVSAYAEVNDAVAMILHRYLSVFGTSRAGCLDPNDRKSGLRIGGLHSLMNFNEEGFVSPCFIPEGSGVKQILYEIGEDQGPLLERHLLSHRMTIGDRAPGMFETTGEIKAGNIVHAAGSNNLSKLSEYYRTQLAQVQAAASRAEKSDTSGQGFVGAKAAANAVNAQYSVKKAADAQSIFSKLIDEDD